MTMDPQNSVSLEGTVQADTLSGSAWTRWKPGGRGQVRFWLAVSRELAGEGYDVLLCAIEPKSPNEIERLERELKAGRTVHISGKARRMQPSGQIRAEEDSMSVIFVAETCGLDGAPPADAHKVGIPHRRHHAHGKMAAAGDVEFDQPELLAPVGGQQ